MNRVTRVVFGIVASTLMLATTGCIQTTEADVVSRNISLEAGEFNVVRRIVFYNGITDTYILVVEGRCQIDHADKLAVTCKVGDRDYKKHYLGLSDNVTYFAEQLTASDVSAYHYKVIFKPQTVVPEVELKTGR